MWFRWTEDDQVLESQLTTYDLYIASLLLGIFVCLCVLLLCMNWVESQVRKEEHQRLVNQVVANSALLFSEPCSPSRRKSKGSMSVEESDIQSSEDELKASQSAGTLSRIPESRFTDQDDSGELLSQSCSQAMLQKTVSKSKKRNRPNSAPNRKKSKN